jgi:hypothetical protein
MVVESEGATHHVRFDEKVKYGRHKTNRMK